MLFYPISLVPQGCFRSDDRGMEELGKKEKSGWTVMNFPGQTFRSAGTPVLSRSWRLKRRRDWNFLPSKVDSPFWYPISDISIFSISNLTFEEGQHNPFQFSSNQPTLTFSTRILDKFIGARYRSRVILFENKFAALHDESSNFELIRTSAIPKSVSNPFPRTALVHDLLLKGA